MRHQSLIATLALAGLAVVAPTAQAGLSLGPVGTKIPATAGRLGSNGFGSYTGGIVIDKAVVNVYCTPSVQGTLSGAATSTFAVTFTACRDASNNLTAPVTVTAGPMSLSLTSYDPEYQYGFGSARFGGSGITITSGACTITIPSDNKPLVEADPSHGRPRIAADRLSVFPPNGTISPSSPPWAFQKHAFSVDTAGCPKALTRGPHTSGAGIGSWTNAMPGLAPHA